MLDLKTLRDDPELARDAMQRRGDERAAELVEEILRADGVRRRLIREVEVLKAERNTASKAIGRPCSRAEPRATSRR